MLHDTRGAYHLGTLRPHSIMALSVVVVKQPWCKSTDHMQTSTQQSEVLRKRGGDLILLPQGVILAAPHTVANV